MSSVCVDRPSTSPGAAAFAPASAAANADTALQTATANAKRAEPATLPNEIVKMEDPAPRRPTQPISITPEVIPSAVHRTVAPSPMRRMLPVIIGAVAFLAAVGILIWSRTSSSTDTPPPPISNPPVPGPNDTQTRPTPLPTDPPVKPPEPGTPPVAPNPGTPPSGITPPPVTPTPVKPEEPVETPKPVQPKSNPRPSGSVAGAAEMLDNINRLERDLEARLVNGEKIQGADLARKKLKEMKAETRKARNAEELREVAKTLDFLEKNLLKRQ